MARKQKIQQAQKGDSYINLIVGIIVVIAIAAVVVGLIRSRALPTQPGELTEGQKMEEQVSLPTKHKVAAGEDLWKISEKYYKTGFNWVDIASENKISDPNAIEEGMELTIPNVPPKGQERMEATAAATSPTVVPTETPMPTQAPTTEVPKTVQPGAITGSSYTVVAGNHLWGIAVRAYGDGYKWVEIARANKDKIANPDLIYPEQVLTLPR